MIDKEAQIDFIVKMLRKGKKRQEILAKFVEVWRNVASRTFDRRLKCAETKLQSLNQRIARTAEIEVRKDIDALKTDILSTVERQVILSKIARGEIPLLKPMVCDGVIQEIQVVPDWMDRKNAISELNKMDGAYTPIEQKLTVNTQPAIIDWTKTTHGEGKD